VIEEVPPQLSPDGQAAFGSLVNSVDSGSKALTIGTLILNIVLSQSLGALWEAINSLQLMAHMSMFSALIPMNVSMFDAKILELVNFDIIPTELIFEKLNLSQLNSEDESDSQESE
jgi:hypothetical protein